MYMSSREFNQNLAKAKRESLIDPVIITDRGKPKHVLMSFERFERVLETHNEEKKSALDMFMDLQHPDVADVDLDIPVRSNAQRPEVDFD
ncbi:MAG: type II toxin-antitoxin system Phd/YefM family antitoxin [Gammaproteobacteria bacterium]|nr:type II toxin-antitoxin system Phd/YefM family antitoxin [Gammaproteobacteria bacterium]